MLDFLTRISPIWYLVFPGSAALAVAAPYVIMQRPARVGLVRVWAWRLILFEVYVPGGAWSGWPPHCHDGYMGSPYLEEVYYYRIDPHDGFAIHRNYRKDNDFDELFTVRSGDLVLVTQGFHPVAAAPGSNVYFLNYLAGELLDGERATPPYDDPDYE